MILAVTAGKGGAGKSTVAYNLAAEIDAVVIDADLSMADLPASRGPDLHDVLAGRATPIEAVRESGPVALLPCGRSLAGARAADPTALTETVRTVKEQYGRVVIDSPAGLRSDAGLPLLAADASLLVTRPTRPALADALRARELARAIETPLAQIALNHVDPAQIDENDGYIEQIASTLGGPVTQIPASETVARAQRVGQPVCQLDPTALAATQFRQLADRTVRALGSSSLRASRSGTVSPSRGREQ